MEDYDLFPQCHLSMLDVDDQEFFSHDIASSLLHPPPLCSESNSPNEASTDEMSLERPTKQLKTTSNWNSSNNYIIEHFSPDLSSSSSPTNTSHIFSFDDYSNSNTNSDTNMAQFYSTLNPKPKVFASVSLPQQGNANLMAQTNKGSSSENQNFETNSPKGQGTKSRSSSHTQDHIIAERKRREKLSQSLIALAALIPGLKKVDKASVLGAALTYMKDLKERLRLLEEESKKRALLECVVIVKKPTRDDDSSSCDESLNVGSEALFPHVDARVSDKEVLLRIHCQKQNGLLVKLLGHIQKLNLFVVNSSVLPFGKNNSIIDITIVAKMGTGYNLTIKDLVANLRVATMNFSCHNTGVN
ncbi:hypothetical protein RIF29_36912 [Crotalaria pallida]|uniref:BHLH domain-containing protein n=1 Tax=Crotalaria pallida TaxID=3830 RepID=A0AAN9HUL6_CROPI